MKYRTVTERVGEYLGPIDWTFDFEADNTVGRSAKWVDELKENLRKLEAEPDAYEATTDGGCPKIGWGPILQVGMYDGWPYWRPHPSVLLGSWAGSSWHSYSAICAIRRRPTHWLTAPIAEVDTELRRLGLDPAEVGAEGVRVAREALAKRGRA